MDIKYLLSRRTDGANPSKIWNCIHTVDQEKLTWMIERMPYQEFLQTAYWLGVSTKRKSDMGMRCQLCNQTESLQVHHRDYSIHGKEHVSLNDLTVLCGFCHGVFHGHLPPEPKRFKKREVKLRIKKGTVVPHSTDDILVPVGDVVVLTRDLINACRANGSFTNATIRAFGMTKADIFHGWPAALVGKQLTPEQYQKAQEGRFIYNSGRLE